MNKEHEDHLNNFVNSKNNLVNTLKKKNKWYIT